VAQAGAGVFRCFVSAGISPEVKAFLDSWVKETGRGFPSYRFGSSQNLHLTLQFLGDTDRSAIPALVDAISSSTAGLTPFEVELGEAGSFPARGAPRILHVSIGRGREDLVRLAEKVSGGLGAIGYRPDKPFVPHITLGRSRDRIDVPSLTDIAGQWRSSFSRFCQLKGTPGAWKIEEVDVMESVLGPKGPTYLRRGLVPLGANT
jgi:2'-5' RNA ligase